MAIIRGNPRNISIHHSAVQPPATNMTMLKQRAAAHNNYHRANSEAWNNTTPGEYGYRWLRYHYMIAQDGSVLQTQHHKYALYANTDGVGVNSFNYNAINIMFEGNYQIASPTEPMMLAAVKLIREIQKQYNINPMVRGHKELSSQPTACPGSKLGTSKSGWIQQLIANVNDKNYPAPVDWRTDAVRLPDKTTYQTNKDTALFEIDTGKRVSEFKKGTKIDIEYEYKGYLITGWSYDRKIKNGFKQADLDRYVPAPPTPVDPCATERKQIEALEKEIASYKNIEDGLLREIEDLKEEGKIMKAQYIATIGEMGENIAKLEVKKKNLRAEMQKKDTQILELKDKVKGGMSHLEIRDLLREIVLRVGKWLRVGNN